MLPEQDEIDAVKLARWSIRDADALLARACGRGLEGRGIADQALPDL